MAAYYFLVPALPKLSRGEAPQITFEAFKTLCEENLSVKDLGALHTLLLLTDIENIRALDLHMPWDSRGLYSQMDLEEHLQNKTGFPEYVLEFVEEHDSPEKRLKHFPKLLAQYFQKEGEKSEGFLAHYLDFARKMRLVIAALRAKRQGRAIEAELRYEDPTDPLVAQILAQRDATNYEPPDEFESLKTIFTETNNPKKLALELLRFQWEFLEEAMEKEPFSFDYVLGYATLLAVVERWYALDQKLSEEMLEDILKERA